MSFAAFLLCPGHISLRQWQHRRLFYRGCQKGDKEGKQTGKSGSFYWQKGFQLYWGYPQWRDRRNHFNVDEGSVWLISFLTVMSLVCVYRCDAITMTLFFAGCFLTCKNYFRACLMCLYCWHTARYIVINFTHYLKWKRAQRSFTVRCLSLSPPDVFFMSSTRRYYWVWREDVPENVSLLLRCEGQSSDQRKSFARDLPVNT